MFILSKPAFEKTKNCHFGDGTRKSGRFDEEEIEVAISYQPSAISYQEEAARLYSTLTIQ